MAVGGKAWVLVSMLVLLPGCGGRASATSNGTSSAGSSNAGKTSPDVTLGVETPLVVSDYFAPSLRLADAVDHVSVTAPCKPRPSGARGACYGFEYRLGGEMAWAGMYWLPEGEPAHSDGFPFSTERLTRVTLQAAVANGSEPVIFGIGGVMADVVDHGPAVADQFSNDTSVMLDTNWHTIEILIPPAGDTAVTRLVGALFWSMNDASLPPGGAEPTKTLFIDDVVYQ